ncbi:hypothetical protein N9O56_03145, partial [Rickettsiales bacterium]|nr:hypothetical protein [Rickettsiales bacterium]
MPPKSRTGQKKQRTKRRGGSREEKQRDSNSRSPSSQSSPSNPRSTTGNSPRRRGSISDSPIPLRGGGGGTVSKIREAFEDIARTGTPPRSNASRKGSGRRVAIRASAPTSPSPRGAWSQGERQARKERQEERGRDGLPPRTPPVTSATQRARSRTSNGASKPDTKQATNPKPNTSPFQSDEERQHLRDFISKFSSGGNPSLISYFEKRDKMRSAKQQTTARSSPSSSRLTEDQQSKEMQEALKAHITELARQYREDEPQHDGEAKESVQYILTILHNLTSKQIISISEDFTAVFKTLQPQLKATEKLRRGYIVQQQEIEGIRNTDIYSNTRDFAGALSISPRKKQLRNKKTTLEESKNSNLSLANEEHRKNKEILSQELHDQYFQPYTKIFTLNQQIERLNRELKGSKTYLENIKKIKEGASQALLTQEITAQIQAKENQIQAKENQIKEKENKIQEILESDLVTQIKKLEEKIKIKESTASALEELFNIAFADIRVASACDDIFQTLERAITDSQLDQKISQRPKRRAQRRPVDREKFGTVNFGPYTAITQELNQMYEPANLLKAYEILKEILGDVSSRELDSFKEKKGETKFRDLISSKIEEFLNSLGDLKDGDKEQRKNQILTIIIEGLNIALDAEHRNKITLENIEEIIRVIANKAKEIKLSVHHSSLGPAKKHAISAAHTDKKQQTQTSRTLDFSIDSAQNGSVDQDLFPGDGKNPVNVSETFDLDNQTLLATRRTQRRSSLSDATIQADAIIQKRPARKRRANSMSGITSYDATAATAYRIKFSVEHAIKSKEARYESLKEIINEYFPNLNLEEIYTKISQNTNQDNAIILKSIIGVFDTRFEDVSQDLIQKIASDRKNEHIKEYIKLIHGAIQTKEKEERSLIQPVNQTLDVSSDSDEDPFFNVSVLNDTIRELSTLLEGGNLNKATSADISKIFQNLSQLEVSNLDEEGRDEISQLLQKCQEFINEEQEEKQEEKTEEEKRELKEMLQEMQVRLAAIEGAIAQPINSLRLTDSDSQELFETGLSPIKPIAPTKTKSTQTYTEQTDPDSLTKQQELQQGLQDKIKELTDENQSLIEVIDLLQQQFKDENQSTTGVTDVLQEQADNTFDLSILDSTAEEAQTQREQNLETKQVVLLLREAELQEREEAQRDQQQAAQDQLEAAQYQLEAAQYQLKVVQGQLLVTKKNLIKLEKRAAGVGSSIEATIQFPPYTQKTENTLTELIRGVNKSTLEIQTSRSAEEVSELQNIESKIKAIENKIKEADETRGGISRLNRLRLYKDLLLESVRNLVDSANSKKDEYQAAQAEARRAQEAEQRAQEEARRARAAQEAAQKELAEAQRAQLEEERQTQERLAIEKQAQEEDLAAREEALTAKEEALKESVTETLFLLESQKAAQDRLKAERIELTTREQELTTQLQELTVRETELASQLATAKAAQEAAERKIATAKQKEADLEAERAQLKAQEEAQRKAQRKAQEEVEQRAATLKTERAALESQKQALATAEKAALTVREQRPQQQQQEKSKVVTASIGTQTDPATHSDSAIAVNSGFPGLNITSSPEENHTSKLVPGKDPALGVS